MKVSMTLTGLDGSNPLGYLAALGSLRLAQLRWPDFEPKLHWTRNGAWRPVLSDLPGVNQQELCEGLLAAPSAPIPLFETLGKDLTVPPEVFAGFTRLCYEETLSGDRRPGDFASSFGSEVCEDDNGRIRYTDFCFVTGSGHQHFLGSAVALTERVNWEMVAHCLFVGMDEQDKSFSF